MSTVSIVDSHVHFSAPGRYEELLRYLGAIGIERAGIVSLPDRRLVNFNPEALEAKLRAPERFFVFGGFDYTRWFYPGLAPSESSLGAQVELLASLGIDGIKMWAGKPTFQSQLGFGLDAPVYGAAYDAAAEHGLPIVVHVADPPQFWSTVQQRFGWSTTDGTGMLPSFEDLQRQAETILDRHPRTIFIFPHLLFRTRDLEAFTRFMREHENAFLDLSPGLYFYGDLHRQRDRARAFFEEFKARILFGTDAMWFDEGHPYLPCLSVEQNVAGARRLLDFLATRKTMENPFALTRSELPAVEGLALPAEVLEAILGLSFSRVVGGRPRPASSAAIRGYIAEVELRRRAISDAEGRQ